MKQNLKNASREYFNDRIDEIIFQVNIINHLSRYDDSIELIKIRLISILINWNNLTYQSLSSVS